VQKDYLHLKVYYYLFLLLAFLLPVYGRAVPLVIILIVLNWLAEGRFKEKLSQCLRVRKSSAILSFSLLFLLYLVSLLYSTNIRQGLFELEVTLSILVFPVIFATMDTEIFSGNRGDNIFWAFCAGCLLASLLMLSSATFKYLGSYNLNEFIYYNLASGKHSSYISMYFSLNIAVITNYLIGKWRFSSFKIRLILVLLLVYFTFMVLLLTSKAGIIALILVFLVFIIYSFLRREHFMPGIILSILTIAFIISAFYLFVPTVGRFGEAFGNLYNFQNIRPDNTESTAERILIWDCAVEAGLEKPLTGYGIGDVKDELGIMYQKNQVWHAFHLNLNAHNQYLQTFLATGLAGLLFLCLSLLLPFITSLSKKNLLYAVFLLLIGLNFLFESMLCRQAGVVFYAFFNGVFLFCSDYRISKPGIIS
jgi:O-antigen ligase